MLNKFTITDLLMLLSAFLSLVFSEVLWFKGERDSALFIGLWVPSILGFAVLLKLINNQKKTFQNFAVNTAYQVLKKSYKTR